MYTLNEHEVLLMPQVFGHSIIQAMRRGNFKYQYRIVKGKGNLQEALDKLKEKLWT